MEVPSEHFEELEAKLKQGLYGSAADDIVVAEVDDEA